MIPPTLYTARWVLPVACPPIADGAVLVDAEGRIEAVAPASAFHGYTGSRFDLGEAALLPGLINVHAHPELTAFRGLLENLPFPDWIDSLMRIKRAASPDAEAWQASARWGCIEAMAAGITTTAATEDSGAAHAALAESGLRGIVYREVFGPDPRDADDAIAGLRERVNGMRRLETSRVRVGISPHAAYTVSDRLFALTAAFALAEELPVAVHAAEAAVEDALVTRGTGRFAAGLRDRGISTPRRAGGTIELLQRTGVLATRPLLIHCVRIGENDVRRLRDAGATVAHCPTANARLAHGFMPLEILLDAGVAVGLGTDSVASNNRLDILEEARLAQLLVRGRTTRAGILAPPRLLELATIDGARALGIDATVGTLERGKAADLCAIRLISPHVQPVHDVVASVMLSARAGDVVLTVVDGRPVYRDGVAITLDRDAARSALDAIAGRLKRAAASADAAVPT